MVLKHFVDALTKHKPDLSQLPGKDWIPGTTKIRTYVSNSEVYSDETDIEKLTDKNYRQHACRIGQL